MRERAPGAATLVVASLANLPVVYNLVADGATDRWIVLTIGFLSMGLAWAAGFHAEGKRRNLVLGIAVIGLLEAPAAFLPTLADARAWLLVAGVASLVGLVLVWFKGGRAPSPPPR